MERKEFQFPPISGRSDLPAGIYFNTLPYDEIERKKDLGYKLVVPLARYVYTDYLSMGAEGFFLSRFMEYVSEKTDILIYSPIWIQKEKDLVSRQSFQSIEELGFDTVFFRERPIIPISSSFGLLTLSEIFEIDYSRNYDDFSILFYLLLVPEFVHLEKMNNIEKIDFSLYNIASNILNTLINRVIKILK